MLVEAFKSAVTVVASFLKQAPRLVRFATIMERNVVQTRVVVRLLPVAVVAVAVAPAQAARLHQVVTLAPPLTIPATMQTTTQTVTI